MICPTIGRSSLAQLLEQVYPQLEEGDEFIVVGDGPQPTAMEMCLPYDPEKVVYRELPEHVGNYGCDPCDLGISIARGDFVWFIGDDDVCPDNVFSLIRSRVVEAPDVPHLFAMWHTGSFFPGDRFICCQTSGQQLVVPRDMDRMPRMGDVAQEQWPVSDWVFMDKVASAWNREIKFHRDDVICILPVMNQGRMV